MRQPTHHALLVCTLLCSLLCRAEDIPVGYYSDIEGKSDSLLKSTLTSIICTGERYEYGANQYHSTNDKNGAWKQGDLKSYGTWQAFYMTDMRVDGSVWDMYSNSMRYFPAKRGESGCSLQIEHCLPKSWWGWSATDTRDTSLMAYKDLWNLNPSDAQANGNKSNYPPGHVTRGDKFDNGSFRMDSKNKSQYGYICFEPEAEYRGDFARAYFYIATAYANIRWASDMQYFSQDSYLLFSAPLLQVLLDWHRDDPVSDKEICRADLISDIQHNRNPFIDYPELVEYIWGNKKGTPVELSSLVCTAGIGVCHEYTAPTDSLHLYDTILRFPALTKSIVNAVPNCYASDKIQSNGTASITMGSTTTDGWLSFRGLNLKDSAMLVFRASVYNSASSMQLDVYAGDSLLRSIQETVVQNTRNEVRYSITIPANTDSVTVMSVGGATTKRACMQELYLLTRRNDTPSELDKTQASETMNTPQTEKYLLNGRLVIRHPSGTYDVLGRRR